MDAQAAVPLPDIVQLETGMFLYPGMTPLNLAEPHGVEVAKLTQLMTEYDPAPPFGTGHPRSAGPELTAAALRAMGNMGEEAVETAKRRSHEPV